MELNNTYFMYPSVTLFHFYSPPPPNILNMKLQNITNLPMFKTIYMRKESINYKCICTFQYLKYFIGKMITNFSLVWFGLVLWHINHCRLFNAKSSLYIFIRYIRFGLVLWQINHCRLFNAKFSWYIYIKYIGFGLVGFYGISTIVGYLMPNPFHTYILVIYDLVWLGFMANQPL